MSREFSSASSQYLERVEAVVTAAPLTMGVWFWTANTSANEALGTITNGDAGASDYWHTACRPDLSATQLRVQQGGAGTNVNAGAYTTSAWQNAIAVIDSATSYSIFLNGGGKTTGTTSRAPGGVNRILVGALRLGSNAPIRFFNGRLAHFFIYDIALSDADVASLGGGANPLAIQAADLVMYNPLAGTTSPEPDSSGNGRTLTLVNGPTQGSDDPAVDPPPGGGIVVPVALATYRRRRATA